MSETLTKTLLLDGLAANVDMAAANFTSASVDDDIQQWALEGLDMMATMAADFAVESYLKLSTGQTNGVAIPSDCLKIVRVYETGGSEATYVEPKKYTAISLLFASGTNSYTAGAQIWSLVKGGINLFRTATTIEIDYVPVAAWVSTNLTIPTGWKGLIIDYVAVKWKMRDEETQQGAALWNMFLQNLQRFHGFEDLKATVGG